MYADRRCGCLSVYERYSVRTSQAFQAKLVVKELAVVNRARRSIIRRTAVSDAQTMIAVPVIGVDHGTGNVVLLVRHLAKEVTK